MSSPTEEEVVDEPEEDGQVVRRDLGRVEIPSACVGVGVFHGQFNFHQNQNTKEMNAPKRAHEDLRLVEVGLPALGCVEIYKYIHIDT